MMFFKGGRYMYVRIVRETSPRWWYQSFETDIVNGVQQYTNPGGNVTFTVKANMIYRVLTTNRCVEYINNMFEEFREQFE